MLKSAHFALFVFQGEIEQLVLIDDSDAAYQHCSSELDHTV